LPDTASAFDVKAADGVELPVPMLAPDLTFDVIEF
jgi:hypothetical protein